ncbi:MAG: GNAT family N-acetyltransferase [Bdellovibrionales bacterium]|nr:GNAT family N-acetyltransferase [Bdellovibrionales bacterium]
MSLLENSHDLVQRWREAVSQNPSATIFQTYEWNLAWQDAYRDLFSVQLLGESSPGAPSWIFPSTLQDIRLNLLSERERKPLGTVNEATDYADIICDGSKLQTQRACENLVSQSWNETLLTLSNLRSDSLTSSLLEETLSQSNASYWKVKLYDAPEIDLTVSGVESFLLKKKSLQRYTRAFEKKGDLRFEVLSDEARIAELLPLFFEQHQQRRAHVGDVSMFVRKEPRLFYEKLLQYLLPRGWLHFSVLWFNDKPLAFHFGFLYRNILYWYTPTFNPEYAKDSPGEVLLRFLFHYSLEREYATFDFTVGNEAFKYRFANRIKEVYRFYIYRRKLSCLMQKGRNALSHLKQIAREKK